MLVSIERNLSKAILFTFYCVVPVICFLEKYVLGYNNSQAYLHAAIFLFSIVSVLVLFKRKKVCLNEFNFFFAFVFAGVFYVLIKSVVFLSSGEKEFFFVVFLMELKPLAYLVMFAPVALVSRNINLELFYKYGAFLSLLIVADFLIGSYLYDHSYRPSVLSESNYDGFLVLLSVVSLFFHQKRRFWVFFVLFLVATITTQSKTGLGVFFIISAMFFYRKSRPVFLLFALSFAPVFLYVLILRLSIVEDLSMLDRFLMYRSFAELFVLDDIFQLIFGVMPGAPIKMHDNFIEWFIVHQGEPIGVQGLHPFNYHSMWLRFFTGWGVVGFLLVFMILVKLLKRSVEGRWLFVFIALQGISMGVFYLTVVCFPLMLYVLGVYRLDMLKKARQVCEV